MSEYKGLCITGPLDGKILEINQPFYRAAETVPFYGLSAIIEQDMLPIAAPMGKIVEYKYNRLPGDVGIFAPISMELPALLKHLINNYRSIVGGEND